MLSVIGCPSHLGKGHAGVRSAPDRLRSFVTSTYRDLGNVPVRDGALSPLLSTRISEVLTVSEVLAETILRETTCSDVLLHLGGDHSSTIGAILAARRLHGDLQIVHIDSHPDFNTEITSETGNVHGMTNALVCGVSSYLPRAVDPRHLTVVGARDIDRGEADLLGLHGVRVISGMPPRPSDLVRKVVGGLSDLPIYLSVDIDVLDADLVPGTGTPVAHGLQIAELACLIRAIRQTGRVVAMDLVEVDPERDAPDSRTLHAAAAVLGVLTE